MEDCVFCRIAEGSVQTDRVYEDSRVIAFYDLSPQAPVHVLIVPKEHRRDLVDAASLPDDVLAHLLRTATTVAEQLGIDKTGFRLVINCGEDAGQTVGHLHIHLLGGQKLPERMA